MYVYTYIIDIGNDTPCKYIHPSIYPSTLFLSRKYICKFGFLSVFGNPGLIYVNVLHHLFTFARTMSRYTKKDTYIWSVYNHQLSTYDVTCSLSTLRQKKKKMKKVNTIKLTSFIRGQSHGSKNFQKYRIHPLEVETSSRNFVRMSITRSQLTAP